MCSENDAINPSKAYIDQEPLRLPATPSRKLLEHALLLIAREHGGDTSCAKAAEQELACWRAANPSHESAYQWALRAWACSDARALRDHVPIPPTQAERGIRVRRDRRRVIATLGIAGIAAGVGRWFWSQSVQELVLQTERAQLLSKELSDGSQVDLGAHTTAHVLYYADRREVRLNRGEARFVVQPDAKRPFIVTTDWGRVRVVGTVFSVAARDGHMSVAVAEGRVEVWANHKAGRPFDTDSASPSVMLGPGDAIQTDHQGLGDPRRIQTADVGAWRQGWLVFDGTRLPEAIDRWNDYMTKPLVLGADPALDTLRLTGSFPMRDPDAFLSSLPKILPIKMAQRADGVVVIRAR
ncbi:FecR family protein [Pollutimonas bauzanensis]|nr:FecR domain-containing protein [Pollutimonas bauzanensis]